MRGLTLTLLLLSGCGDAAPPATDASGDPGPDATSEADAAADGGADAFPTWIDVHTHCGVPSATCLTEMTGCCTNESWTAARERFGGGSAVLLSTEHWAVNARNGDIEPALAPLVEEINEMTQMGAVADPTLFLFPSLECWYDTPAGPGWADACKADADRWVAAGARGFKDHAGKQFDSEGRDGARFLGAWNRLNGFCTVDDASATPNRDCMEQPTVRYPALDDAWREVLRYILEDLALPVVSHTISYGDDDPCYDPSIGSVDGCGRVTKRTLVDLAIWLGDTLSLDARRRFIAAHLGFLVGPVGDAALFLQMLDTGISTETAANLGPIARAGCEGRRAFALYPDQMLFGTDRKASEGDCGLRTYEAWFFTLTADIGEERAFDTCVGPITATGMQLGTASVPGCEHDVPEDILDRFLRESFLRLYE